MSLRVAGFGMVLGGMLFFTRMIPVMRVIPDDMNFPPTSPTNLARLVELAGAGWPFSHIMGLVAVVLFTLGYWAHARVLSEHGDKLIGKLSAFTATLGFGAFAVALVIDGFGVPSAANIYLSAAESAQEAALIKVGQVHGHALDFFTPGIFIMFLAMGLLSSRLIHRLAHYRWLGFVGMAIAIAGPTTYLFGVAGPHWDNLRVGGSLMMLGFLWHLVIGLSAVFGRGTAKGNS